MSRMMPLALLVALTALPLHADPLLLPWGGGGASMAAGGSHAPAPLLGEVAPDAPTSLALADRPRVTAELMSTVPVSYVHGRRRFADLRVTDRDLSAAIPLADAESESQWWLGGSVGERDVRVYHRDRWLHDRARGDGTGSTLALAWRDGQWTLGAARHEADLAGAATGQSLADLLHMRRGHERLEFGWDGGVDTLGAEFRGDEWSGGVQVRAGDDSARAATEVSREPFSGVLHTDTREFDAWVSRGSDRERWFAYLRATDVSPGQSAIASGEAIRGRASVAMDGTAIGIGRMRSGARASEHLELSRVEQSVDLSGRVNTGALGSLDGQVSLEASARVQAIGARWGATRRLDDWSYTLAASVLHADLDLHARGVSTPGPFQAPDWRFEERLRDGEAWLASLTAGAGYEADGWEVEALYTLFTGDSSGEFVDLIGPQAALPPDPPTGPSPTIDLGWVLSVKVSREL